jgi:hypothetical protein
MNRAFLFRVAGLLLGLIVLPAAAAVADAGAVPVAGWLERARLFPGDIPLEAKLDSASRNSSLHALNVERFEREGADWVAFDIVTGSGGSMRLERPVVRVVEIQSAPGRYETRVAVKLGICIGQVFRVTEVNLVDRSTLSKPLLVGRRFLRGRLLVDTKRRFLLEPECKPRTIK